MNKARKVLRDLLSRNAHIKSAALSLYRIIFINKTYHQLSSKIDEVNRITTETQQSSTQNANILEKLENRILSIGNSLSDIELLMRNNSTSPARTEPSEINDSNKKKLLADRHQLDGFYKRFEDKFRGSEKAIQDRVAEHLPLFLDLRKQSKEYPVLDIGCGRGEFLKVMKENDIRAVGLDINQAMVERVRQNGLEAELGDANKFLDEHKNKYSAITGFHIVEHIPFEDLMLMFKACHGALIEDGFVMFETPNPENMIVATSGFYTDPSHLNPLPPDLLQFAIEESGFRKVSINRLHPVDEHDFKDLPTELVNRFYGPRDYAVIGYK